jgi:hypothetical protein
MNPGAELPPRPRDKDELVAYAKATGKAVKDYLVLAPNNDPFNAGTPADWRNATWFAELHGGEEVRHLRRLFYVALSHEVAGPDGELFMNSEKCWGQLCLAASKARALRLIDPSLIVDARNPPPKINFEARQPPTPEAYVEEPDGWSPPSLRHQLDRVHFEMPEATTLGYAWDPGDEPVHLEVWVEKTTMDDVLEPLCRYLNVNFRSGPGFASITNTVDLIQRAATDRPVRIFYISDFDPAGATMPRSVARQIEYWADEKLDIALTPLVLTGAQVAEYDLPRVYIKDSDRRRGNFEAANGEGAVELDALEALHPGQLAVIVRRAILEHRDPDIRGDLRAAHVEADAAVTDEWHASTRDHAEELTAIEADMNTVLDSFRDELAALSERLDRDLAGPARRLAELRSDVAELAETFTVDLPDRPIAQAPPDRRRWLFHSRRNWLAQLHAYRRWTT